jgi:EpsI family protein
MRDQTVATRRSRHILVGTVTIILVAQAGIVYMLSLPEMSLGTPSLQTLPVNIGQWSAIDENALEPAVAEYLRPDDYILRDYVSSDGASRTNLFVAYFKSLQNNYGPHSPRHCLPGSGWVPTSWKVVDISVPGRANAIPVNQYLLEKNGQHILVLYWYQNSRRIWAEEYQIKLNLLPDLLQYRRSDISLVRIVMPLSSGASLETPLRRSTEFVRDLFPLLVQRLSSRA